MGVRSLSEIRVGIAAPKSVQVGSVEQRLGVMSAIHEAGLDHVGCSDHVSFHGGSGMDGLVGAAQLSSLHDTLPILVAVYLLPLRHPTTVARQLSTYSESAPGRLIFGVGIGGEDPLEYTVCGVDPRSRGLRANESLAILRRLMRGESVDYSGRYYDLQGARVLPAPEPAIPILVGGRSDAAVRRTARYGDGYLGVWVSPRRFAAIVSDVEALAEEEGRGNIGMEYSLLVWCGLGGTRDQARARVRERMQSFYRIDFEKFEPYTPYGSPEDLAEFLAPYVESGCQRFHLMPVARNDEEIVELCSEVKRLLVS